MDSYFQLGPHLLSNSDRKSSDSFYPVQSISVICWVVTQKRSFLTLENQSHVVQLCVSREDEIIKKIYRLVIALECGGPVGSSLQGRCRLSFYWFKLV